MEEGRSSRGGVGIGWRNNFFVFGGGWGIVKREGWGVNGVASRYTKLIILDDR